MSFSRQFKRFVSNRFGQSLWTLTWLAALTGIGLLYWSSGGFLIEPARLRHDLFRDVGIAFVVAAIIAAIYELHARARFDRETLRGVLGSIYNDFVDGRVSGEIWSQILDKEVVRKRGRITIGLEEHPSLPANQHILWAEFEYDLCGLRSTLRKVILRHFLDSFMSFSKLDLPRFDRIVINEEVLKDDELASCVDRGIFQKELDLEGREGKPIPIMVSRHEIVYVPGAYHLIMGELTGELTIHLHKISDGIELEVNVKNEVFPLEEGGILQCRTFFLPHQNIEFRFKPKAHTVTPAPSFLGLSRRLPVAQSHGTDQTIKPTQHKTPLSNNH
ncbi:MAG TPA: hypothetical protein VGO56_20970 [Pyrinomonadaceae bacterium]|jgi:hypothetical protein|nr:hypothetical protein [Pyrinomonadaceae bacterium]